MKRLMLIAILLSCFCLYAQTVNFLGIAFGSNQHEAGVLLLRNGFVADSAIDSSRRDAIRNAAGFSYFNMVHNDLNHEENVEKVLYFGKYVGYDAGVICSFYKDQLYRVKITFFSKINDDALVSALTNKYGTKSEGGLGDEWELGDCSVFFLDYLGSTLEYLDKAIEAQKTADEAAPLQDQM